ncbi:MAG: hypothetical protein ACXVBY_12600, partial [Isosphaeraceae bacterium]
GSVPLRTFGQLKQLWEARVDATPEELAAAAAAAEAAQARAGQPQGEPSEVAIPPGDSTHPEQVHPESAPSAEPNSGENETQ